MAFGSANQGIDASGNLISDGSDTIIRLANASTDGVGQNSVISLGLMSVGVLSKALQNLATLRADNGATMSQLRYAHDNLSRSKTNLAAGAGRIQRCRYSIREYKTIEIQHPRASIRSYGRSSQHYSRYGINPLTLKFLNSYH